MQFSTIIVSALAGLVAAAPTANVEVEERAVFNPNQFNFQLSNFGYLAQINQFDAFRLQSLVEVNNFDLFGNFNGLFNAQVFDIQQLLELQNLLIFQQLAGQQVFNQFDLTGFKFNTLNLGLLGGIGGVNLNSFLDASIFPQVNGIARQSSFFIGKE